MSRKIDADLCIIGAGSGGLSVAAGAAQLGRKVVLIEKGEMGGDCLNYGCVPSKALIAAAARAQEMRDAGGFGVKGVEPEIDFPAVMDHVHAVIADIAPHDSVERFESLGVTVIRAGGEFIGPRTVKAGDAEITAKRIVIATGSSPFVPPIPGLDGVSYFTNETIFENRARPDHLIVIGGGPIGVELAQAHRRLGARTTIVEADTLLNRDDPEAVEVVRTRLKIEGVDIREKSKALRVEKEGDLIRLVLDNGAAVVGSHLLVAVGRRANLSGLGLDKAGIELDGGKLRLDARLRTTNRRVYAIGDAAGGLQFTHVAGDHASTLVKNILFKAPAKRRDALAPRVTYCSPELASIGISESEAQKSGAAYTVARWPLADNDRARAERDTQGFVKATIGKGGRILGATVVGAGAGDLIAPWSLAIANNLGIRAFTNMIAAYPTRSEISKRAAGAYYTPTLFSARTRRLIGLLATFD
ncbi:MAG: dihydrolipoamide dehydrogenase [Alphaproteobacteria bacterium RIFCSPHIGHO2_12_FULL_63_12]|nr:MAG: dihydrolipoamide dehydrogenase [Alphaproteobacteria bacterium RIFCSPHIGHO2_12_FULL_63_12]